MATRFTAHISQIFDMDSEKDFEIDNGEGTFINACMIEIEDHKAYNLPRYAIFAKSATCYYIEDEEENEIEMPCEEAVREMFSCVSPAYSQGQFCEMVDRKTGMRFPICWKMDNGNFAFLPKQ